MKKNNKKQKSIKVNFIFYAIKTVLSLIFPLITFPYASRVLLPNGIGKINFADSIIAYFVLLASLGINTYAIREGAKVRDDKNKLSTFCQEILIINIFTTIISYIILFIMVFHLELFNDYKLLIIIFSATICFNTIGVEWLYGALEEYKYISIRTIIFNILSILLLLIFVKNPNDYIKYAMIQVFASVGSNILNLFNARKYISFKKKEKYNFKKHLKPILIIFGLNIACNIYMNFDKTCLGLISGDESVGLYTASLKIIRMTISVITIVGTILLPRLTYCLEKKEIDKFKILIKKAFNFVFMFSIPSALGIFILSSNIIGLLSGPTYQEADITMKILTLIIPTIGISNLIAVQIFIPFGKEIYSLISSCVAALVNLSINLLLIPHLAQNGAAIGTVVAELFALIFCILLSRKVINLKGITRNIYQYLFSSLSIIIIYYICSIIFSTNILLIISTITLSGIVYFILLYILKNEYILEVIEEIKTKLLRKKEV